MGDLGERESTNSRSLYYVSLLDLYPICQVDQRKTCIRNCIEERVVEFRVRVKHAPTALLMRMRVRLF